MAEQTVVQFRMDAEMKEQAEALYRRMGMDLAEGFLMFVRASLAADGLPFQDQEREESGASIDELAGSLRAYVTPERLARENEILPNAFERMVLERYGADADDPDRRERDPSFPPRGS